MSTFDVVAIDPEIEAVAIGLHVSIALAVLDDSADRKTVKRGGERTEDNGRVNRHVCGLSSCEWLLMRSVGASTGA